MKAISHHQLGQYLAENYMPDAPRRYTKAFLLGCVEPDQNPATYLKGSIRNRWLRGHNWESANCYIRRISRKLERKKKLRLRDYYNLGKLIHYTADAFTYTHNRDFHEGLLAHRHYEARLHDYFTFYIAGASTVCRSLDGPVMEAICDFHSDYVLARAGVETDVLYSVSVCAAVFCKLKVTGVEPASASVT